MMLAAGGTQLKNILEDIGIYAWQFHVDWKRSDEERAGRAGEDTVAPYHYLCDGQLTNCVPQPGSERRLDAQGDKIMARLVYRERERPRVDRGGAFGEHVGGGRRRSLVRVPRRQEATVSLFQQGTYAPDGFYRWMASPAIDKFGNIGIGYSFGGRRTSPVSGSRAGSPTIRRAR